jgi:CO/xanthine dehydrogenase FAD-binding subunit
MLMVYEATAELVHPGGERSLPVRELFRPDGIARNHKRRDELLRGVALPAPPEGMRAGYEKLRLRDSIDFPSLGIAMALSSDGGKIGELRVATTALHTTPDWHGELGFAGAPLTEETFEAVGAALADRSKPVRNLPFPPAYRKKMVAVLARRLLARLGGGEG